MWAVLIIAFSIAFIVGPIMLMRPSQAQTRLAKLRELAQQKGLRVGMEKNPTGGDPSSIAVYTLPWVALNESLKKRDWQLNRQKFSHELHFYRDWDGKELQGLSHMQKTALIKTLTFLDGKNIEPNSENQVDHDFVALRVNKLGVSVMWNEKLRGLTINDVLDRLSGALSSLRDTLAD